MSRLSPHDLWEAVYSRFATLPRDQYSIVAKEYELLRYAPENEDRYNHELLEMAIQSVTRDYVSLSDYADEYERYEAAQEIIDGLSGAGQR